MCLSGCATAYGVSVLRTLSTTTGDKPILIKALASTGGGRMYLPGNLCRLVAYGGGPFEGVFKSNVSWTRKAVGRKATKAARSAVAAMFEQPLASGYLQYVYSRKVGTLDGRHLQTTCYSGLALLYYLNPESVVAGYVVVAPY